MGPSAFGSEVSADHFPFGFVMGRDCDQSALPELTKVGWTTLALGPLRAWLHPRTSATQVHHERGTILVVGHVFLMGHPSTEQFLSNIDWDVPWGAISQLCGRFIIALVDHSQIRYANDPVGSRPVFYHAHEQIVSSHALILAVITKEAEAKHFTKLNKCDDFHARKVKYLPGDISRYENIYSLAPNHALIGNRSVRYFPENNYPSYATRDVSAVFDDYMDALFDSLAGKAIIIGITGGLDSRLILAAAKKRGVAYEAMTWVRNSIDRTELDVIEKLVSGLGVRHRFVPLSGVRQGRFASLASSATGGVRGRSTLVEAIGQQGWTRDHIYLRGFGGEIMRGFYSRGNSPLYDYSAKSMARAYGGQKSGKEFLALCESIFSQYQTRADYESVAKLPYSPNDLFYWEHRMGMGNSLKLNEMDPALESLAVYNCRKLFDVCLALPEKVRTAKSFFRQLVVEQWPKLDQLPYH